MGRNFDVNIFCICLFPQIFEVDLKIKSDLIVVLDSVEVDSK